MDRPAELELCRAVPLLVPNVQLHSWFTAWDQDESPVADAGGYGDPELDTGFNIRRARFGVNGGFERVVDHVEANSDYTQPKVADDGEKIDKNEKRAKEEEK